ncbi:MULTISPECIES: monovalent cation:proton antiporter-2 (CPA2) family protein [Methylobacter]
MDINLHLNFLPMTGTLQSILILLTSAVLAVALFRVLRLPTKLAYFLIGLLLGPHAFGLLPDSEANHELAEFGIVFLMFSIGLEFSLPQLYAMRRKVFGLGGAQVALTMLLLMAIALPLGIDWREALILAGALAMSSTAIVSKMMVERLELHSRHGQLAIGILLFQDLAVVPLLILIPALAEPAANLAVTLELSLLKAVITLAILLVFGKLLVNSWFDLVARQRSRELFVMNVLLVTLALAFVTKLAGLSYALGAFIAGMLISETRYRYQVEADIAPFRDILLGLFFVTVGMLLDVYEVAANIGWVLLLTLVLVLIKATLITLLTRAFNYETGVAIRTGITLAQAGEFSFVILALGAKQGLLGGYVLQLVLAASVLSMVLAPFLIQHSAKLAGKLSRSYNCNRGLQLEEMARVGKALNGHVIICGYGRSGQYLSRFLTQENIPFIALEIDTTRVREASGAGENVMYGDAGRRVVLQAAGVDRAKAVIISYNDTYSAMKILHVLQENYPQLPVIVRTVDESNMEKLREAGAAEVVPEVLEGSLMLASHALLLLGVPLNRVVKNIRLFREEHYKLFRGFFHGISDYDLEANDSEQLRLHSVEILFAAYAKGLRLFDVGLETLGVEVKSIRRSSLPKLEPTPQTILEEGDVLVLLGKPGNLDSAERLLLTGK